MLSGPEARWYLETTAESHRHAHGYGENGLGISIILRVEWHTVSLCHSICEIHKKHRQQTKPFHEMGAVSRHYAKLMEAMLIAESWHHFPYTRACHV